jgi:hypothetical protein
MTPAARSLELFFIDGRPDGMLTAEVFNWTGHVLRIPRTHLKKALGRAEIGHTGVYVLVGEDDDGPLAYIGEAENLRQRLKNHVGSKPWWDTATLIGTTGDLLNKAHIKYLESRLIEIALEVGAVRLENGTRPPRGSLTEAAQANMESFLETLGIVLPAIRLDIFLDKSRPGSRVIDEDSASERQSDLVTFRLSTPKHAVEGFGNLIEGEWIVKSGSRGRSKWIGNSEKNAGYLNLHETLLANGTLKIEEGHAVFQKDYAFSSPSAAAAILNGQSANGRTAWRETCTGKTFAEWEENLVMSAGVPE